MVTLTDLITVMLVLFVSAYTIATLYLLVEAQEIYGKSYAPTMAKYLVKALALVLTAGLALLGLLDPSIFKITVSISVPIG